MTSPPSLSASHPFKVQALPCGRRIPSRRGHLKSEGNVELAFGAQNTQRCVGKPSRTQNRFNGFPSGQKTSRTGFAQCGHSAASSMASTLKWISLPHCGQLIVGVFIIWLALSSVPNGISRRLFYLSPLRIKRNRTAPVCRSLALQERTWSSSLRLRWRWFFDCLSRRSHNRTPRSPAPTSKNLPAWSGCTLSFLLDFRRLPKKLLHPKATAIMDRC